MSLRDGPFPNKGWVWYSPQTKWQIPHPLGVTFQGAVDLIVQHRLKNPSITKKHNLSTDWSTVADELETFTRQRLGLAEESPPKWLPQQPKDEPEAVAGGVEGFLASAGRRLKAVGTGIKVYIDVFGESGRPVQIERAEQRAIVCSGCPRNEKKATLATFFTEQAAKGIMEVFSILESLDLKTAQDSHLGVCSACLCPLRQKVHVKLTHIVRHMDEETKARLDPRCWILSESNELTATQQNELRH